MSGVNSLISNRTNNSLPTILLGSQGVNSLISNRTNNSSTYLLVNLLTYPTTRLLVYS